MKSFHTYIERYHFLTPDRIFGNLKKTFEPIISEGGATIYFIVKCKKARWLPKSFKTTLNYTIRGEIDIDGVVSPVDIDMAKFWYAMPVMQKNFPDKLAMASYFLDRRNNFPWGLIPKPLRYKLLSYVEPSKSTSQALAVQCEIMRNGNESGGNDVKIFVYQAINLYDLPAPKLDIIYIGSSLAGSFSRLESHEKWGRIFSEKKEDEDILIYFCEITGDVINENRMPGVTFLSRNPHGIDRSDETMITEMTLINHFKPPYNEKHKNRGIEHSTRVQEKLLRAGYSQVDVEVLLGGVMGKLGSSHLGTYGAHTAMRAIV